MVPAAETPSLDRQPSLRMAKERRGAGAGGAGVRACGRAEQTHSRLFVEAPELTVPADGHPAQAQPHKVRTLLTQQASDRVLLGLGRDPCAKSPFPVVSLPVTAVSP